MWSEKVTEPFRDDPRFWSSVGASVDALFALAASVVLFVAVPGWTAVAFVVPAVLLVKGWRDGRASSAGTRPQFDSVAEWREHERQAVASALPGALVRRRF